MRERKSGLWVILAIFAVVAILNVARANTPEEDALNDVKPSTGTSSSNTEGTFEESLLKMTNPAAQQHFSADVTRMMGLIINSLYANKEIFLRELVSNAADAVDKIRFMSITNAEVLGSLQDMSIKVKANPKEMTLSIHDTGIGMTKNELINNLGTIARSGTSDFISKLSESNATAPADLIGQFGVGFYSGFLVADRVTVVSKSNDDNQYIWKSDSSSFEVLRDPRGNTLERGTEVILHLKDEAKEYLQQDVLKKILKKYSQFVSCPLYLWESRTEKVEEEESVLEKTESEESSDEAVVEEEKPKEEKKMVEKTVEDWVLVNDQKPIWTKKPSEVAAEEYTELFQMFVNTKEKPLAHIHFSAEGEVSFNSVLFIPPTPRPDFLQSEKPITDSIKLYVRRVFITENVGELLPQYLSFVYGIVDSDNLPLNVSRETLQHSRLLKLIKAKLVRKVFDMLQKMSKDDYDKFWEAYGVAIKLGVFKDVSNKARLTDLVRFHTSKSEKNLTSFAEYISRMKEGQEHIYYINGQSIDDVKNSPFVERVTRLGFEVIYFTKPMDEYLMQSLREVKDKPTQNLAKVGLDLLKDKEAKEQFEEQEKNFRPFTDWLKDTGLAGLIKEAKISQRLESSPCALVADEYSLSGSFQKIVMAQAYANSDTAANSYYLNQKHTLEVNPRHPLIKELKERIQVDPSDPVAKENALLLFDTTMLRSGFEVKDMLGFAERVERVMRKNLDVDLDEKAEPSTIVEEVKVEESASIPETDTTEEESPEVKEEL